MAKVMEFKKGYSRKLDDRFSIHIADSYEVEVNALLDFNKQVHPEEETSAHIRLILLEFPRKKEIYWLYIKDNQESNIVSSLCLSPMEWQIENTELPVCEMEFVGTLETYRQKGFIKTLNELYENIMEQHGYLLSVIRGIPYFYRTLGYEFVSSLDERIMIQASKIPKKKNKSIKIRKANSNDIALIKSKYTHFHEKFSLFTKFNTECFKFKYLNDKFNSEVRSTYIFEKGDLPENYFSMGKTYDNQYYEVICSDLTKKEMIILLQFIKTIGKYNDNDMIIVSVNKHTTLFNYIRSLGGELISEYGWQVKIPDIETFLFFTKKVIENRLRFSEFKGLTKSISISNYKETFKIDINSGKIEKIERIKEHPDLINTDLRIPGALLYMLLLGDKSIDEISYIIKDAVVNPLSKKLIETMFPKKPSLFESYL